MYVKESEIMYYSASVRVKVVGSFLAPEWVLIGPTPWTTSMMSGYNIDVKPL